MAYMMLMVLIVIVLILYFLPPSGAQSCLCSKTEECEITEDNELEVVPNVTQVREIGLVRPS